MRLRYTALARADLENITAYISKHAPQGARKVLSRIQAIIAMILLFPHSGTRTTGNNIYRIPTAPYPYIVFYEPLEAEIIIHAIRHDKRNP